MGIFLAIVPAIPYSILHRRAIGWAWLIFIVPALLISYLMNQQGTAHYQMEIAGIPILILIAGAILSGLLQKKLAKPSPQLVTMTIGVASVFALAVSYWGYSAGTKIYGLENRSDPPSANSGNNPSSSINVRDKSFFKKGYDQHMTRPQLIAEFGPPDVANDLVMAYRGVRPENGKETLCIFSMEWRDDANRVVSLSC
jgi:hypothetical protein